MRVLLLIFGLLTGIACTNNPRTPGGINGTEQPEHTRSNDAAAALEQAGNTGQGLLSLNDLHHLKVAVAIGTTGEQLMTELYPGNPLQIYPDLMDAVTALEKGLADAAIASDMFVQNIAHTRKDMAVFPEPLRKYNNAVAVRKGEDALLRKINAAIAAMKADSTLTAMDARWFRQDGSYETVEIPQANGGEPLVVAMNATRPPVAFHEQNGKIIGFEAELAERIALALNRPLKIMDMSFGALVPAVSGGKADIGMSGISVTEERKKEVNFSIPYSFKYQMVLYKKAPGEKAITSIEELKQARMGAITGTSHEQCIKTHFPEAELLSFSHFPDLITALLSNKIEGYVVDYSTAIYTVTTQDGLRILPEHFSAGKSCIGFRKGNNELRRQVDRILEKFWLEGVIKDIHQRWLREDGKYEEVKIKAVETGKPLLVGVDATSVPFVFHDKDKRIIGADMELAQRIALELNRPLALIDLPFGSLLSAVSSGKADMILSNIFATEERRKSIDFSIPYYEESQVVIVKKAEAPKPETHIPGFWAKLKEGFHKNLLVEERYTLILKGLGTTLLISFFALLLGTLLGFAVCFCKMSGNKLLQGFANTYITVLRGTPMVVLLMIVFYVIFARIDINAVVVAVIAFGLNSGAYIAEIIRTGIMAVDHGQTEAGLAMGFRRTQVFLLITLPQTIKNALPVYQSEIISLIKGTAIVGYIAIQDLTKAGDIIRSRTYDAFFPLIMVALIYLGVTTLLIWLFSLSTKKTVIKKGGRKS